MTHLTNDGSFFHFGTTLILNIPIKDGLRSGAGRYCFLETQPKSLISYKRNKKYFEKTVVFFLKKGVFASHLINTTKEREGKQNEN